MELKQCKVCDKTFYTYAYNQKSCSRDCASFSRKIDKELVLSLAESRRTQKEIGEMLGCSQTLIGKLFKKWGYSRRASNSTFEGKENIKTANYGAKTIYIFTQGKWRRKHHVIAEKILGRKLEIGENVEFIDGNRLNLDPNNLLVTNQADSYSTIVCTKCGEVRQVINSNKRKANLCLICKNKGEDNHQSKLTEKQVIEIRKLHDENGLSSTKLSKIFPISQSAISAVILRKSWKHVP